MKFEEYRQQDAVGLAALVAAREVSPGELLDCALQRAAEVNPGLNAIVTPMHDIARQRTVDALAGPLAGVWMKVAVQVLLRENWPMAA